MSRMISCLLIATFSLTATTAMAQQDESPTPAEKQARLLKQVKHNNFDKRLKSATKRIEALQSDWSKIQQTNTPEQLKRAINMLLFASLNIDTDLKALKKSYAVARQRRGVRAVEKAIRHNKAFADHLQALKLKKKLDLDALDQKTYDEHLKKALARVQTLPKFKPK